MKTNHVPLSSRGAKFRVFLDCRLAMSAVLFCILLSTSAFADLEEPGEPTPDLTQPARASSLPIERLGDGFANIVYGPLELVYQMKQEISNTDLVRGFVPGLIRGLAWFGIRI